MARTNARKTQEIAGAILLFLTLILLLALLTFQPTDPPRSTAASARNLIGTFGAYLAEACFRFLGLAAYFLVIPPAILGVRLIWHRPSRRLFSGYCSFLLLVLSVASLVQVWVEGGVKGAAGLPFAPDPRMPGGILGMATKRGLESLFNPVGTLIILFAMLTVGLMLLTPLTFGEVWGTVRSLFSRGRKAEEESRELETEEETEAPAPDETEPPPSRSSRTEAPPVEMAAARPAFVTRQAPAPMSPPTFREKLQEEGSGIPEMKISAPLSRSGFRLPPVTLLTPASAGSKVNEAELMEKAGQIIRKLAEFGLEGSVEAIHPGPVVTLFEFKPAPGVKYSRIVSLLDDLCLGLRAESIRVDRIPGKSTVGIEVPNSSSEVIQIRDILESAEFAQSRSRITLGLGKRINGDVYVTDLGKMPHLLVAGATGQGKSVGLNTMITSILFKATPDEVKFIFIDPKRLELGMYADIPHLLTPIVTDAKLAAGALIWAVREMEERYKLLAKYAVKDIETFNRLAREHEALPEAPGQSTLRTIPFIVIVIDELAELLSVASKEVELCLQRLAQMARAVGIHIVMATQRPSVEVVTGIIKANFPSRISFRLLSKHDSKTILDQVGAEHLLGKGDMLILPPNSSKLLRVHGAYISEEETKRVVDFLKSQASPQFQEIVGPPDGEGEGENGDGVNGGDDPLYEEVARFIVKQRKASTSILQRRFRIGYGRAARLMDLLEQEGIVGPADGSRPRDVLVPPDFYDAVDETRNPDE
ncbi:MAG: DNA translocase FtsK 4TM domain-containing protein [Acidobacteria bacterium]|nr:DNA translocase FtsK 4TM domain-containing protein [Acidobacteriota bacterium]